MKKLIAVISLLYALFTILEWTDEYFDYEVSILHPIIVIILSAIIIFQNLDDNKENNVYYNNNNVYYNNNINRMYWDNDKEIKEIKKKIVKNYKQNCVIKL